MKAYLFDVDGVLTDPVEKKVTDSELFTVLLSLLHQGDLVAINTGRSIGWVIEKIMVPLMEKTEQKELFSDVIVVGEKGGTWVTFIEEGSLQHERDQAMTVPQELNQQIRQLVQTTYKETMFFDSTKETMISVEMHDGFSIPQFHQVQKEFIKDAEIVIAKLGLKEKYKIDPSTISTDIEEKHAGKALGVDRLLTLLMEKNIHPSKFVTFGDSSSDLAMADELQKRNKEVRFVYTGDKERLGNITKAYPVDFAGGYSRGTLEYLKSHLSAMDENHS